MTISCEYKANFYANSDSIGMKIQRSSRMKWALKKAIKIVNTGSNTYPYIKTDFQAAFIASKYSKSSLKTTNLFWKHDDNTFAD